MTRMQVRHTEATATARSTGVAKLRAKPPMPWREVYTVDTVGEAIYCAVTENA